MDLRVGAQYLASIGFDTVVLPFILIYVILFATFERTKILGTWDGKKSKSNFNSMASFVMSFMFIAYNEYVLGLNKILPSIALFIVMIFFLQLLLGFFGLNRSELLKGKVVTSLIFLGVVLIFGFSLKILNEDLILSFTTFFTHPIIWISGLFLVIIMFISGTSDSLPKGSSKLKDKPEAKNKDGKEKSKEKSRNEPTFDTFKPEFEDTSFKPTDGEKVYDTSNPNAEFDGLDDKGGKKNYKF